MSNPILFPAKTPAIKFLTTVCQYAKANNMPFTTYKQQRQAIQKFLSGANNNEW